MYKEYCTGCGLCSSVYGLEMQMEGNGFREIKTSKGKEEILKNICPVGGSQCNELEEGKIWGRKKGVYISYSCDPLVRKTASSGGVLTAIGMYLIDNHIVDGIIQVRANKFNPIETEVVCSKTKEDILECMGSRYSSSMPLGCIDKYLGTDKKYAFIGKPCDVTTLRNYFKLEPKFKKSIPYMFSFFCAGVPSRFANIRLLKKLNCTEDNCIYLRYRGDGWPGYATGINSDGFKQSITYREAWRDTLGRDIRKICRFCLDGIGELADISCGDAWYLDENKQPIFEEADGRNVVFCRTKEGKELYDLAVKSGYLCSEDYKEYEDELPYYQAYQYNRRASMGSTFAAMKIMGRKTPLYDKKLLKSYSSQIGFKHRLKRFIGTLQRIRKGKI